MAQRALLHLLLLTACLLPAGQAGRLRLAPPGMGGGSCASSQKKISGQCAFAGFSRAAALVHIAAPFRQPPGGRTVRHMLSDYHRQTASPTTQLPCTKLMRTWQARYTATWHKQITAGMHSAAAFDYRCALRYLHLIPALRTFQPLPALARPLRYLSAAWRVSCAHCAAPHTVLHTIPPFIYCLAACAWDEWRLS